MSYNTNLQNNNIDLQAILNTINNLPESGGGNANFAVGSFTVDTKINTNTLAIEHGLGCTPDLVAVFTCTPQSSTANKGTILMIFDAVNMTRYHPSAANQIQSATDEGDVASNWVNDTTFTLYYKYWYYGVGEHIWIAMKRGA